MSRKKAKCTEHVPDDVKDAHCDVCGDWLGTSPEYAAGYAEAVGDVVAWLDDADRYARAEYLTQQIKDGAHVGAAKKASGA